MAEEIDELGPFVGLLQTSLFYQRKRRDIKERLEHGLIEDSSEYWKEMDKYN